MSVQLPIGYAITVMTLAWCTYCAINPNKRSHRLAQVSFIFGFGINELPLPAFAWLFASTLLAFIQDDINSIASWIIFAFAILTASGLVAIFIRGLKSIREVSLAIGEEFAANRLPEIEGTPAKFHSLRVHFFALAGPFFRRKSTVERVPNISYGNAGKRNFLDIYRHRSHPGNAPVLIHFHGGAMVQGKKNREGLPLLYRLAGNGWICISANYRLQPANQFPAQLVDAKKVIVWARKHGREYGADTSIIFVAGASAGGQLAIQAALTANKSAYQPGFEEVDTAVTGAIGLYGYYGWFREACLRELKELNKEIPPIFIAHGDKDTITNVEDARYLVDQLRKISPNAVVYAELTGAQHNFDLFHSVRTEAVIDGIEIFTGIITGTNGIP